MRANVAESIAEAGAGVGKCDFGVSQLAIVFVGSAVQATHRLINPRTILTLCLAQSGMHDSCATPLRHAGVAVSDVIYGAYGYIHAWAGARIAGAFGDCLESGGVSGTGVLVSFTVRRADRHRDFGAIAHVALTFALNRHSVQLSFATVAIGLRVDTADRIEFVRTAIVSTGAECRDLDAGSTGKTDIAIGVAVGSTDLFEILGTRFRIRDAHTNRRNGGTGNTGQLDRFKPKALKFLREKTNNFSLQLDILLNETIQKKFAYTPLEKYTKLLEKNEDIALLKSTFNLDM